MRDRTAYQAIRDLALAAAKWLRRMGTKLREWWQLTD